MFVKAVALCALGTFGQKKSTEILKQYGFVYKMDLTDEKANNKAKFVLNNKNMCAWICRTIFLTDKNKMPT